MLGDRLLLPGVACEEGQQNSHWGGVSRMSAQEGDADVVSIKAASRE
jgi:hypothetical protein